MQVHHVVVHPLAPANQCRGRTTIVQAPFRASVACGAPASLLQRGADHRVGERAGDAGDEHERQVAGEIERKGASRAMNAAPAIMASDPERGSRRPSVPGGTGRKVRIERGGTAEQTCRSRWPTCRQPQRRARRAPPAASVTGAGLVDGNGGKKEAAAKTPPLAMTCVASRAPPLATTPPVSCSFRRAEAREQRWRRRSRR